MKMKTLRFYSFPAATLLSFGLLLSFVPGMAKEVSAMDGSGSLESPYQIETAEDLQIFSRTVNEGDYDANGILTSNIIINGAWAPIGGSDSSSAYTGNFNGNGYTVTFSAEISGDYQGLFAYNKGTIKDVSVEGVITGTDYAGAIAAVNSGTIQNCQNSASVSGSASLSFVGGIAGVNMGIITDSSNQGNISSQATGSNIGGIAGAAREGSITNCTNQGTVSLTPSQSDPDYAEGCVGGITGLNYKAAIEQAGNYGAVSNTDASGYTGGVAGLNNGSITNSVNGASIKGTYYAGGVAGYNFLNEDAGEAHIHNVLNHGEVTSDSGDNGAVCGVNQEGVVYDSYYLEGTAGAGIGTSDNNGTTPKTQEALESGEVAYQLNGNQSAHPMWYQTLGSDPAPVLDSSHGTVYRHTEGGEISYSNTLGSHTDHDFDDSGSCTVCGYKSVSLYGHSLTLDGAIGLNYYYYIDPMYYQNENYTITATFGIMGRTETASFDPGYVLATGDENTPQVYGFQLHINSDEMTAPIQAKLEIKKGDQTLVTLSDEETFRGYDYLTELYENKDQQYSRELQDLAQALATHDYYANEHFKYGSSYDPIIPLLPLDGVTSETLLPYAQTVENQSGYPAKHYALSMQFLSKHILYLYITSEESLDTDRLYMGYKVHGTQENYKYVQAEKYGNYYRASTEKTPAAELDTMWDCAFFLEQEDGSYQQITAIKTAGPLSYAASSFQPGIKTSLKNLNQALYLYYEASKTYFDSISQE